MKAYALGFSRYLSDRYAGVTFFVLYSVVYTLCSMLCMLCSVFYALHFLLCVLSSEFYALCSVLHVLTLLSMVMFCSFNWCLLALTVHEAELMMPNQL